MADSPLKLPGITVSRESALGPPIGLALSAIGYLSIFAAPKLVLMSLGMMFLGVIVAGATSRASTRTGTLVADRRDGLLLDGRPLGRRFGEGWIAQSPHGAFLRLEPRTALSSKLHLRLPDVESARAVLGALGIDVTQATATARVRSRAGIAGWLALVATPFFMGFFSGLTRGGVHPLLVVVPCLIAAAVLMRPTLVTVGADGVLIRWLGTKRFVPLSEIESVVAVESSVQIVRRRPTGGAQTVTLRTRRDPTGIEAQRIVERIKQAIEKRMRSEIAFDPAVLARASREPNVWVEALRAISSGRQSFREAGVARAELWRIVEDGGAPPVRRAAAAVALGTTLDDDERTKLRVLAGVSASPQLRVALEGASESDDAQLAEALAALDLEEREGRT